MLVADSAVPTARTASAMVRGAGAPASGGTPARGPDRLLERLDARFAADSNTVSVLLVTPDGPVGELRPRAVWPPRSIPPAAVVQASVRASRTDGVVTACVDERRPQGATVVAARIETRDRLLGIVSVMVDGPPRELARAIAGWLELFEGVADDGPRPDAESHAAAASPTSSAQADPDVRAASSAQAAASVRAAPTAHAAQPAHASAPPHGNPGPVPPAPAAPSHPDAVLAGAAADEADDAIEDAAVALRAVACHRALFRAPGLEAGVRALLALLARQHGCARVACGWTAASRREGIVVSDTAEARPPREVRDAYAAAMDEALARGAAVAWPEVPGRGAGLPIAQSRLAGARGVVAVCSVPLGGGGGASGALTLERDGAPFDAATLDELERVAAFLAPAIAASRRASRPLAAWLADLRRALPGGRRASGAPVRVGRAPR